MRLDALIARSSIATAIYLDALDEVMVPVAHAGLILGRCIQDRLAITKPVFRLSCRSAVWPSRLADVICDIYGKDDFAVAMLQPLSLDDVKSIAAARGVDADAFVAAVKQVGALTLAQQPLTLKMLLRLHEDRGSLPQTRRDLFAEGVRFLASERSERLNGETAIDVPLRDILDVAERLACFTLLSGREVIDLGEYPPPSFLGWQELQGLPNAGVSLDHTLLRAVGRCGLCEGEGSNRFRFAHRQFAEYLAGRRLARLLPHQTRSLLSSGLGWQAGVAGPLRETAAFAAMECSEIAAWVTETDPEVVGISDVADESLRRRATLNLLSRFSRHELIDSQIILGDIEVAGLRYENAEEDLRPVLRERQNGCEDVLICAIKLVDGWKLVSMSDDLADLVLDNTAPTQTRISAGYALAKFGTLQARHRLLSLIEDGPKDSDAELKGLALQCNWPENVTVPQLLNSLTRPPSSHFYGAYAGFLSKLDFDGFNATGYRLEGLAWAKQYARESADYEPTVRIAKRIAIAALDEIDQPGIADALADLLLEAAESHSGSPLVPPRSLSLESEASEENPTVLSGRTHVRRKLLVALTARSTKPQLLWYVKRETPDLISPDDFPWLMQQATDATLSMPQREKYADLALMLPWYDTVLGVDAWLVAREIEPVASRIKCPLYIVIDSEEATQQRKALVEIKRWNRPSRRRRLKPPPAERVLQALELSETKDPRFFLNICRELTLEEYSTVYGFERFLTKTPGWSASSPDIRQRIIEGAKRLLSTDKDEPELGHSAPLNSILHGYMHAIWLVMECEPPWIESLPPTWWALWAQYILRELHPNMIEEANEFKVSLLRMVHHHAADKVHHAVEEWAIAMSPESRNLLTSLLGMLSIIPDPTLDRQLCLLLTTGKIPEDRIGDVARFVLDRNNDSAVSVCLSLLESDYLAKAESVTIQVSVALLQELSPEGWSVVLELLNRRPDLRSRILAEFAHGIRWNSRRESEPTGFACLTFPQVRELATLLLKTFPQESDPVHEGAHFVGPDDSARELRSQVISWLGEQKTIEAVEVLRALEQQFGTKYPWLRRPRARAERAYRLSRWIPITPRAVAELLVAADKRLIRSDQDAVEGIIAAIEQYDYSLRHDSPNDLEDLWNVPRDASPTPKNEERVSDKICVAVREYFRNYAVTADREVQIFRRKLKRSVGGAPGSELDVLCRVPAVSTPDADPISVPIEVKLSHNPEARTGLIDQLVNRYMSELGTNVGVFVVVWMGMPRPPRAYRSIWKSPAAAKIELEQQATDVVSSMPGGTVRVAVINASLPTVPSRTTAKPRIKPGGPTKSGKTAKKKKTGAKLAKKTRLRPKRKN